MGAFFIICWIPCYPCCWIPRCPRRPQGCWLPRRPCLPGLASRYNVYLSLFIWLSQMTIIKSLNSNIWLWINIDTLHIFGKNKIRSLTIVCASLIWKLVKQFKSGCELAGDTPLPCWSYKGQYGQWDLTPVFQVYNTHSTHWVINHVFNLRFIISRPWRSQRLLYKQLRDSLINWLIID